jgi:outer membrane receptor protein involved in Fe transport
MKKLLFLPFIISIGFGANGQEPIEADLFLSVDSLDASKVRVLACSPSVDKSHPLFIIDGVPFLSDFNENVLNTISPDEVVSISILKGLGATTLYGTAGKNGVVIVNTNKYSKPIISRKRFPFKVYNLYNDNWTTSQDMFNAILTKVPGLIIRSDFGISTPKIQMRGDDNTIVLVDGIRYDASILNTLNSANIESVTVAPSVTATHYFINN